MENRFKNVENKIVPSVNIKSPVLGHSITFTQRVKCLLYKTRRYRTCSAKSFLSCNNYKYKRRNPKLFINDVVSKVDGNASICDGHSNGDGNNVKSEVRSASLEHLNIIVVHCVVKHLGWIFRQYVEYAKMLRVCSLNIMVIAAIMMLGLADLTEAGVCWTVRESNGKCTQRYSNNMSEEECCKHPNFAYTEREMSDVELFFAAAIDDGAVCKSCLDSCEAAKCGTGKRCVYRKGRPKCVCAPVCRSSAKQKGRLPDSGTKHVSALVQTKSSQPMPPKEQRPFPSFFGIGGVGFDSGRQVPSKIPINNKTLDSINITHFNSEVRWRRASQMRVTEALRMNSNETEHSVQNKRRKNQRKSKKLSKRRKQSTTPTSLSTQLFRRGEIDEQQNDNRQGDSSKNGRIIIKAGSRTASWSSLSQKHRKSPRPNASHPSKIHHNRHQSKKEQQRHQSRLNRTFVENGQKQRVGFTASVLLDEKIRNGFFHHGFPYPSVDDALSHSPGRYHNPVCGSDGKTYKTECQLKKRACRRESTTLTVAYRGHCQTSCKTVRCLNNLTCVEDQYGLPHCISCTITCPQDDASSAIDPAKAVCGADGLTYRSICDINRLICTTGRSIAVSYHGTCQEEANCNTIQCRDKQMCLNDLLTNKPRCISCSFKCPRKRRPQGHRYQEHKICGTNNLTYHSWCQMRRDSCNTGFYIDVKHVGACHTNSLEPKPKHSAS